MTTKPVDSDGSPTAATVDLATGDAAGAPEGHGTFTRRQKVRGGIWSLAGVGGGQTIRFLSNIVMTRLLLEEAFGLMQILNTFLSGLSLFTDIGLQQSLVQNKRGEEASFRHTAWTLQIVRGIVLSGAAILLAPSIAVFYEHPELEPMISVCAATLLIRSFGSTSLSMQRRRLNLKAIAFLELSSQSCAVATTIVYALLDPTPWAFVAGQIVGAVVFAGASHFAFDWRERLRWDRAAVRSLVSFGSWIFISTALMFLANQADRLIFGKMIPIGMLGVSGLARGAAAIPQLMLGRLVTTVAFPVFCDTVRSGVPLGPQFSRYRAMVGSVAGLTLSGMFAVAPQLIDILYPDRYRDAGWMLRILSAGMFFGQVLAAVRLNAATAHGMTRLVAATNAAKLAGMVVLLPLGFELFGFAGAIIGYACADLLRYAMAAWRTRKLGVTDVRGDLMDTLVFATAAAASIGTTSTLASIGTPVLVQFVVGAAIVGFVWFRRAAPWIRKLRGQRAA